MEKVFKYSSEKPFEIFTKHLTPQGYVHTTHELLVKSFEIVINDKGNLEIIKTT